MDKLEREMLLVGTPETAEPVLLKWLDQLALERLVGDYFGQAHEREPEQKGRACGFISPDYLVLFRTPRKDMEPYCRTIRDFPCGAFTCRVSDHFGASVALRLGRPFAYCCGGLVYDYCITLYTTAGAEAAVFIDGQMRPDPPSLAEVRYLRDSLQLPERLIEDYKRIAPLTHQRVGRICQYLRGGFASAIGRLGRRYGGERLDVDRFARDVDRLEECLAALVGRRPLETVWEVLDRNSSVRMLAAMVSSVNLGGRPLFRDRDRPAFVSFISPGALGACAAPKHLNHLTAAPVSALETQAYEKLRQAADGGEPGASQPLDELGDVLLDGLDSPFRADAESRQVTRPAGMRASDGAWTHMPCSNGQDEFCCLSLHLSRKDRQDEQMLEEARNAGRQIGAYMARCDVARSLWSAFAADGLADPSERQRRVDAAVGRIRSLRQAAGHISALAKWGDFLGLLGGELERRDLSQPAESLRGAADWLAATLACPAYERRIVAEAEMFLSQRPFSSERAPGSARFDALGLDRFVLRPGQTADGSGGPPTGDSEGT